jgi:hypothetical protein
MNRAFEFRPDVVNQYTGALLLYLDLMERSESVSTVEGAECYLLDHAQHAGTPELTSSEWRAIRFLIRNGIGRDNRVRGGQKRIESVEVEGREGSRLTFRVRYSDRVVASADAYREHSVHRDSSWARGDGWPDVSFELTLAAELRWQRKREAARTTRGSN